MEEHITPEIAAHVVNWFNPDDGYRPGTFTESLIKAISVADPVNVERVRLGFPGYVAAMDLAKNYSGGMGHLKRIMGGL